MLNLANPDALIVRENIARYHTSGRFDAGYLASLSADATPALVAGLGTLGAADQSLLNEALKRQHAALAQAQEQQGWPAWHLGRARARAAIESLGIQ